MMMKMDFPGSLITAIPATIIGTLIFGEGEDGLFYAQWTAFLDSSITLDAGTFWLETKTDIDAWQYNEDIGINEPGAIWNQTTNAWELVSTQGDFVYGIFGECETTALTAPENTIKDFTFYPNPSNDFLVINANEVIDDLQFFDVTGRLVLNEKINGINKKIDLTTLPQGVYIVKAFAADKISTFKIIKK